MSLKSHLIILASILAFSTAAFAEVGLYGLYGSSPEACRALQKEALERVASAKIICNSANSEVQWSKNSKEPVGAFTTMRAGARIAMKRFTPLYSCERADLVVKIAYDCASESVTLAVSARERPSKEFNHVCNALRRHGRVASGAAKSHQETNVTSNAVADCAKARQVDEKTFLKDGR